MSKPAWSLKRAMKGMMLRNLPGMITCVEFEDFIVSYLDGTLDARKRRLFERHIRLCRECREYLAAYRRSVQLGKAVFAEPHAPVPADVPEDLVDAVLKATERS